MLLIKPVVHQVSSSVDRGIEPISGQNKDYTICIFCFSAKHTTLKRKSKTGWLGIKIMCPSGATYVYPRTVVSVG